MRPARASRAGTRPICVVAVAVALGGVTAVGAQAPVELSVQGIAPSMYIVRGHPHGNVVVAVMDGGVLLVDAQSAPLADALADTVAALGRPVRWVINTHYHEDHIGGNAVFARGGAVTFAHVSVPAEARKDTTIEVLGWHRVPVPETSVPSRLVGGDTTLLIAGRRVDLLHAPGAHSDGDMMVWFPDANVLHMGDVYELAAYPFIDWPAGGTVGGMVRAVDRALGLVDDATVIVPGHGPPSDRAELAAYRAMLVTVRDAVQQALADGLTVEQTMDLGLTAAYDEGRGGSRAGRRFAAIVYLALGGSP